MALPFLPAFAGWLRTLGDDVLALARELAAEDAPPPFRQASAEALSYLLRARDLIPEGIEDLGYLEVACAFRAIGRRALEAEPGLGEAHPEACLPRLAAEAGLLIEFLDGDVAPLAERVSAAALAALGRPPGELVDDAEARGALLEGARAWAEQYRAPALSEREEELVKLRSFFRTRLERPA